MKFLRAPWPGGVWTRLCVIVVTFAAAGLQPAFGQSVVFNEVMYHPVSTNLLEDFVELYNPATTNVDLTNWKLKKAVQFTFPSNTVINSKGYLVVAADRHTFTNKYPAVANFVAGWTGRLSRSGETIQLEDAAGETVNEIYFAPEGDWAIRRIGAADQYGKVGWEWFAEHDGSGKTLELINSALPNIYGQNWGSSTGNNGTPGQANSVARTNIAPLIEEVSHFPMIPKSTDAITITARIIDERTNGLTITLFWHVDGTGTTNTATMLDDGAHGDGLANDGIYGAVLPTMTDGTIVEFYLQARDLENNLRTFPNVQPSAGRTANLVLQVDNSVYAGVQPIYRVIMASAEYNYLSSQVWNNAVDSDAEVSGTFITTDGIVDNGVTTKVRYSASFRNRGHGSRNANPHNIRVGIPKDNPWKKRSAINLNTQYTQAQLLGSMLFRRLGMPMADSRPVQVRVNGANLASSGSSQFGSYEANDEVDTDMVKAQFPLDDQGNLYRGIRDQPPGASADFNSADLACGTPSTCYTNEYFKQNNTIERDFSDIIQLIQVMNPSTPLQLANYTNAMRAVANVDEWMKYMAVNTILDNQETHLGNGYGDDYALYRGTNDTRFLLLPYDMDSIMGDGTRTTTYADGLFRMNVIPAIERMMTNQVFLPLYYRHLRDLSQGTFAPANMNVLLDQLREQFDGNSDLDTAIANMKSFNASQISYILGQMPLALSVSSALTVSNGYPRTTSASVALTGFSSVVDTRSVRVNSNAVPWNPIGGAWSGNVTLQPGINRVLVQAFNDANQEFERTTIDIWYDDSTVVNASGTIANTTWTAAGGPYNVTGNLIVPAGVTLTIQPGATVYVASGVTITVNGSGKILAQGTETQRIRIGKNPAASGNWGSLDFIGTTVESRLAYVDFDSCGGTTINTHNAQLHVNNSIVFIDHCTWPSTPVIEYISFDASSFIVQNCLFPSYPPPSGPESLHGINGIPNGGYGIFRDNYFGHTWGFNDTIDFTGGNRPGPILQIINNVFDGASDDCLDLDSTDAWIEGNTFLHVHRDPTRTDNALDTASAISGGVDTVGQNSDWTILNNIFYDVDHVFLNKGNSTTTPNGGGRVAFLYNTVIHVAKEYSGSTTGEIAAFNWSDDDIVAPDPAVGSGMYAAYNIIYDCATLQHLYNPANHTVIMENNILSVPWSGPGTNNRVVDPLLNLGVLNGTYATNVTVAQLREAARLLPGSPAIGAGFGARDIGWPAGTPALPGSVAAAHGIVISGPAEAGTTNITSSTSATFLLGPGGTFNWGTNAPQRWGWTAYKWKLDGGAYSAEIAVTNNSPFTNPPTIALSGLANGTHTVSVVGKNDAGYYQDDTLVYPASAGIPARVTVSKTWTVNTSYVPPTPRPSVRLNEILASNSTTLTNGGTTPDLIEIYNFGTAAVDLTGMGVSDNVDLPYKFTFPATTTLAAGTYLVIYADSAFAAPGFHTGFTLKQSGDDVYLFDKPASGGALLDSVVFGIQLTDQSIGRRGDGSWGLCKPTFGQAGPASNANVALSVGLYSTLKINEWLADAQFAANHDFIELYNPDPLPVALGGLFLSDAAGALNRNQISDLSFIAGNGLTSFVADGDPGQGADHLNFHLSPDVGIILLSAPDLSLIDAIAYGPQQTDVSQGRSPNGADTLTTFAQPTDGSPNPGPRGGVMSVTNITSVSLPLINITTTSWKWDNSGVDQGTAWRNVGFIDTGWSSGFGLFGFETTPSEYAYPFQTDIPAPNQAGGHWTVYYRTHFQWTNGMTNFMLISTNYIDDGALYYLNGTNVGGLRMTFPSTYTTPATLQNSEGVAEILAFPTNSLVTGDNVMAVEVHQNGLTSSDDVFGMALSAVQSVTNIINSILGFTPVILNEVLADNQTLTNSNGRTADWVEFYNPSNSVDLSDCSLSDDPNNPRKWVFPTNSTIASKGYLVIYCDPDLASSRTNTGFGLSASGETLFLFDRPAYGGGLLDSIRFGLQTPDFAIGRIPSGTGNWTLTVPSRGTANAAASLGNISLLRVNEWMANPSGGDDDWFEIYNTGAAPVALGGLFLTDDLTDRTQSPISPLSFIGSGGNGFIKFIADGKPENGADHVSFKLNNGGEQIGIYSPSGTLLNGVTFGSQIKGVSQGRFPDGSVTIVSFSTTASPGEANYLPIPNVVISELLSHTDPPFEDALELFNPTINATNITGWFLSNSKLNLKKYRITNSITLGPNGYTVFYENQFGNTNSATAFTFNSAHGDEAILSAADGAGNLTGYRVKQKFGAAENGISFGRYQTSIGFDFTAMSQHSFGMDNPSDVTQFRTGAGATNAYPKVGPVVINEIMYHPVSGPQTNLVEEPEEEFLELRNITGAPVQLFDPSYPTNTWKVGNGVEFKLPTNITIAANAYLLVVGFNPATDTAALASFRTKYGVSNTVPVLGPWQGRLDNGGEALELYKPDTVQLAPHPDAGFVPYILADRVVYQSVAPWSTNANGTGASLQRIVSSNYGNDPVNWGSGSPTAGRTNAVGVTDTDHDGMPDSWEIANGFNPADPNDALGDADGDGISNLNEYLNGTNPRDLRIISQVHNGTNFVLQFSASAGKNYSVAYRTNLVLGVWTVISNVPPVGANGNVTITDPDVIGTRNRFYRVTQPNP